MLCAGFAHKSAQISALDECMKGMLLTGVGGVLRAGGGFPMGDPHTHHWAWGSVLTRGTALTLEKET